MQVIKASILMVLATCLLTFVSLAALIAPPVSWNDRDVLLWALAGTGVVLGGWAGRELFLVNKLVRQAQPVL